MHGKIEWKITEISKYRHTASYTINVLHPRGTLATTDEPMLHIIFTQSPQFTLRFMPGFVHSIGLDRCIRTGICHYHIRGFRSVGSHGLGPFRLLCPWDSPGKNTGVGCHALLQGIFPTQELNPGLLNCRWIPDHLSYREAPRGIYTALNPLLSTYSSLLSSMKPWQPLIFCLRSLPFAEYHVTGIIQYVASSDWLLSLKHAFKVPLYLFMAP